MTEVTVEAHGRVNLIGEHTDYNGGFVLPTLIPQKTEVFLRTRSDQMVRALSSTADEGTSSPRVFTLGQETPTGSWIDYLQGVTQVLTQAHLLPCGFEVHVRSDIPMGSGLSSSAALEVAFLRALQKVFDLPLNVEEIARIGQRAENEFVGARVGIMDQMACAIARSGEALFLDTLSLHYENIPMPLEAMDMIVLNSGLAHQHAGGDYNQRRSECERACQLLGITSLREITWEKKSLLETLPEVLNRRAFHVVSENRRVLETVTALKDADLEKLGALFYESHASMSKDYQVSIPEIDTLIEICREHGGVYGARLTGGGFGGSIVALTRRGHGEQIAESVIEKYGARTGHVATLLVNSASFEKRKAPERQAPETEAPTLNI